MFMHVHFYTVMVQSEYYICHVSKVSPTPAHGPCKADIILTTFGKREGVPLNPSMSCAPHGSEGTFRPAPWDLTLPVGKRWPDRLGWSAAETDLPYRLTV